jgi:hypothetical protein
MHDEVGVVDARTRPTRTSAAVPAGNLALLGTVPCHLRGEKDLQAPHKPARPEVEQGARRWRPA